MNQKWVISLQKQIIDKKQKQLDAVQNVVMFSVESNFKEQFKSYSLYSVQAAAGNFFGVQNLKLPVKVSLSSHSAVHQVLCQVKKLHHSVSF